MLRVFDSCSNTDLLEEFDVVGIKVIMPTVPQTRYICQCGTVDNKEVCPHCGNTDFRTVDLSSPSTGKVMIKKLPKLYDSTVPGTLLPANTLFYKMLTLKKNYVSKTFELCFSFERSCSATGVDFSTFFAFNETRDSILPYVDALFGPGEYEKIENVENVLFGSHQERDFRTLTYAMFYKVVVDEGLFTMEELHEKRNVLIKFVNRFKDTFRSRKVIDIDAVMRESGIPKFLKGYLLSESTWQVPYRSYSSPKVDVDTIPLSYEMERAITYALVHEQLGLQECINIISVIGTESHNVQASFVDFFIKNVSFLKTNVLARFKQLKEICETSNPPVPVDVKSAAILKTEQWMCTKGVNASRTNYVLEIFDKDPMVALKLLTGRKALSPEEKDMVKHA